MITGGPATGKTSLIEGLEREGYTCFQEIIRDFTAIARQTGDLSSLDTNPINAVSDPLEFNRKLLEGRKNQFEQAENSNKPIVFFDRGIHDILAYMDYYGQALGPKFIEAALLYKYDFVFLLPMWEDIFETDEGRFESFEDSLKIQECLRDGYERFENTVIEVPFDNVENRIKFILDTLNQ